MSKDTTWWQGQLFNPEGKHHSHFSYTSPNRNCSSQNCFTATIKFRNNRLPSTRNEEINHLPILYLRLARQTLGCSPEQLKACLWPGNTLHSLTSDMCFQRGTTNKKANEHCVKLFCLIPQHFSFVLFQGNNNFVPLPYSLNIWQLLRLPGQNSKLFNQFLTDDKTNNLWNVLLLKWVTVHC